MSIPQSPSPLSNILAAKTYNAAWFSGSTKELQITAAIAAAVTDGALYVYVPANMAPYNSTAVTFNSAVQMLREGGPVFGSNTLDAGAYGGLSTETTITTAIAQAVAGAKKYVFVSQAMIPYNTSLVTFNSAVQMFREGGPALGSNTLDVGAYGGLSKEVTITAAIAQAVAGLKKYVYIAEAMLPYNAALVTFNNTIRLIREGTSPNQYDIRAYGAAGDNVTDDTTAIQACLTAARAGFNSNSIRNTVYACGGTYLFSATLDFSDISVWGDGQIATSFRRAPGGANITPSILVAGGQASYQNWNLDGNSSRSPATYVETGIEVRGGALWTTWLNIYIHDTSGHGMVTSFFGGLHPFQHQFINLSIRTCQRIGLRIDAGRNLGFYNLDVETCGLFAASIPLIAITGSGATASRLVFDATWLEKAGIATAAGDAVEIDAGDKIVFRKGNVQEYGLAAGGGGHGFNIIGGTNIEIDGMDISGRAASQANQRKIKIAAGVVGVTLRNMPGLTTAIAAADLEDLSTAGSMHLMQRTASSIVRPTEAVLVSGVDSSLGDAVITTLTAARLVGAPLNPVQGQRLVFTFIQGGAGGFAVTWNAVFKKTWADAGNAAGTRSSIAYVYDGTNWNQDGAQTPYV